jgi:hypothetical protein
MSCSCLATLEQQAGSGKILNRGADRFEQGDLFG